PGDRQRREAVPLRGGARAGRSLGHGNHSPLQQLDYRHSCRLRRAHQGVQLGELMLEWLIPSSVVILLAILKISRQAGRIEEGVKGLYARVDRLERQSDRNYNYVGRRRG